MTTTVFLVASYVALCLITGLIAREKRVLGASRWFGFWTAFYVSPVVTPLPVFLVMLCIPPKEEKAPAAAEPGNEPAPDAKP